VAHPLRHAKGGAFELVFFGHGCHFASGCYSLSWNYDAWGNRLSQNNGGGSCLSPSHAIMPNNRITDIGYSYDAAGNMTSDGVHSYTYDAENRLTKVDGGATNYIYDPAGQRALKNVGGAWTEYFYDLSGNVHGEWSNTCSSDCFSANYVYLNGSLLAEYENNTTYFIHKDHLGSTRVITGMAGAVSDSMDYLPYGEQISGGSTSTHKFTGKEHDAESGLDLMGARYFGSSLGRFMTSDPLYLEMGRLENPQALNLYAYVLNNPLNLSDPTGLDVKLQCQSDDKKCSGKTLKNLTNNLNARKNAGFKVKLGKDGLLAVQGKVDASKLNKSEEALYHAITDKDNHATLNVVSQSPTVNFDKFDGHGQNTVDASDMGMLAKADQSVAGEVLAHGMMEAYTSAATGNNLYSSTDSAGHIHVSLGIGVHQYASNFFPGGEPATPTANGNGTFGADVKVPALGITIGVTWAGKPPSNMTGVTVTKENQ
jgi:RHS repeat-associated protein